MTIAPKIVMNEFECMKEPVKIVGREIPISSVQIERREREGESLRTQEEARIGD